MIQKIQSINLEDISNEFQDEIYPKLGVNGGNVLYVNCNTDFGKWLALQGFVFDMPCLSDTKTWAWLVVFR